MLRGRRLFKVEKQFWRYKFWDVYGKRQDFHKISMWLGVHSKWWVQQQRKHQSYVVWACHPRLWNNFSGIKHRKRTRSKAHSLWQPLHKAGLNLSTWECYIRWYIKRRRSSPAVSDTLDKLRLQIFHQKVATSRPTSFVQIENLPPTSPAAKYHNLRVYLHVLWKWGSMLIPHLRRQLILAVKQ